MNTMTTPTPALRSVAGGRLTATELLRDVRQRAARLDTATSALAQEVARTAADLAVRRRAGALRDVARDLARGADVIERLQLTGAGDLRTAARRYAAIAEQLAARRTAR